MDRRDFLQTVSVGVLGAMAAPGIRDAGAEGSGTPRPNVLFIITDDQGYGDLGCHGNPALKTPRLDRLHGESIRLSRFHVCPVCSPTRACLMTGRYNYRTGVVDTYAGRSMMATEEKTVAAMLKGCGYRTGIFGKWHLGDTWPLRPMDRGFEETLVHLGGGITQPSDPEFYERENTYFNPTLQHNGEQQQYPGYCTDVFTTEAIKFMEGRGEEPFFAYVAFNAPHTPLQVPEEDAAPYLAAGLQEETARVYGMIANVDRNVGRLLDFLDGAGIAGNTVVIFMTDNGAQKLDTEDRWDGGQRGWKGTPYEGGIRVPCFIRWPEKIKGGRDMDRITAHIDLTPTLLDLCACAPADRPLFDGKSLMPLLTGEDGDKDWPERTLFFQWHRGDVPEAFKNSAVLGDRWKLVNGVELYDLPEDPKEEKDLASAYPEVVQEMREAYLRWFKDVGATRGYAPVRIRLGSDHQNPVVLTRQDWHDADNWTSDAAGYWEVLVEAAGSYTLTVDLPACEQENVLHIHLAGNEKTVPVAPGLRSVVVEGLAWNAGPARLECYLEHNKKRRGVHFVHVKKN